LKIGKEAVDLTAPVTDSGRKKLTLDIIANNSFISWEGTVHAAQLYTLPIVKNMLRGLVLPLRKYLECMLNITDVSVNYANAFEWMALKRFQELFPSGKNLRPCEALPRFLNTPIFGNCLVSFSSNTQLMPKITEGGNRIGSSLYSLTAHPENWKDLLALIDALGDVCIKPRSESSSSDCLLFTDAMSKKKQVKLTLGLAVKNYSRSTKFSVANLDRECYLFNRMFEGTNLVDRLNILVIVCTNYHKDLEAQFKGKNYLAYDIPKSYAYINELILLDLSTAAQRADFYDTSNDLSDCIESIISKAEAEHKISERGYASLTAG